MGYTTRGSITDYWPDNTPDILYIDCECGPISMADLTQQCHAHFRCSIAQLNIRSEKIQTSCLYYDLHDPSDWTNFLIIERNKSAQSSKP